jgi:hypothetical protein
MSSRWIAVAAVALACGAAPGPARAVAVDLWTDRGNDAVYEPGERIILRARPSEDAYLLVYEIDAEGSVHLLYPDRRGGVAIPHGATLELPGEDSDADLVVSGPVGEGYIVAIASLEPFEALPWYLRPTDPQAEQLGYQGEARDEEEGFTTEGRIVGDPFVAMERIRRRVLAHPLERGSFATAYTSYYVHHEVSYPRYLCADCHRPNTWTWWDGFDPYVAQCSVFSVRVNWSWGWGPAYWYGAVPYYVYAYRPNCPPRYRHAYDGGLWHSSWDGLGAWQRRFGPSLQRTKSLPPAGYVAPGRGDGRDGRRGGGGLPPGYLPRSTDRPPRDGSGSRDRGGDGHGTREPRAGWAARAPAEEPVRAGRSVQNPREASDDPRRRANWDDGPTPSAPRPAAGAADHGERRARGDWGRSGYDAPREMGRAPRREVAQEPRRRAPEERPKAGGREERSRHDASGGGGRSEAPRWKRGGG